MRGEGEGEREEGQRMIFFLTGNGRKMLQMGRIEEDGSVET